MSAIINQLEMVVGGVATAVRTVAAGVLVGSHIDPLDDDSTDGMLRSAVDIDLSDLLPFACRTVLTGGGVYVTCVCVAAACGCCAWLPCVAATCDC